MRILMTNENKVTEAINAAEGRATSRTITYADIMDVLNRIRVPKSKLDGTSVHWDGGQKFPSAYKYTPESTHWCADNIKGKWYLTDVYRATCPNHKKRGDIKYSEAAKAWIIENASQIN